MRRQTRGLAQRRLPAWMAWPALAAGLAFVLYGCGGDAPGPQTPAASKPAATESFLKEQGLAGRVALIQFGLVGQELSEAGLKEMASLNRAGEIQGLAYVRVEQNPDRKAADDYFAAQAAGLPVHHDPESALAKAFDATAWPTYVLVDKFGHVRYRGSWPGAEKVAEWVILLREEGADRGPGAPMFGVAAVDVPRLLAETKLPDLKGDIKPLREHIGKGGLMAVFVDTKCPFSGQAIGEIKTVAATLARHNVSALLINIGERKKAVEECYAQRDVGAPVLYDVSTATQKAWKVDVVPTVVLFDSGGAVAYRGKAVWKDVGAAAEKTLSLPAGTLKFGVAGTGFG